MLATEGYPVAARTGDVIEGLDALADLDDVTVFHAGTRRAGDAVLTDGGRVLDVVATGATIDAARTRAYAAAALVSWPGMQYRTDIAALSETPDPLQEPSR